MQTSRRLLRSRCSVRRAAPLFLPAIVLFIAAGCATPSGPAKPATASDREFKCFGTGMDRKTCIGDATRLCYTGFEMFEKDVAGDDGVVRSGLYFRCNP